MELLISVSTEAESMRDVADPQRRQSLQDLAGHSGPATPALVPVGRHGLSPGVDQDILGGLTGFAYRSSS
jgi:hypothetical protein